MLLESSQAEPAGTRQVVYTGELVVRVRSVGEANEAAVDVAAEFSVLGLEDRAIGEAVAGRVELGLGHREFLAEGRDGLLRVVAVPPLDERPGGEALLVLAHGEAPGGGRARHGPAGARERDRRRREVDARNVRASPGEAHEIGAGVKYSIREAIPRAVNVLVHMEPYRMTGEQKVVDLMAPPPF